MSPAQPLEALLESVLGSGLATVRADGIAIGVAFQGSTVFGAAGSVAGTAVDRHTVMYGAKTVRLPERRIAVAVLSTGGVEDEISTLGTDLADQVAGVR